MADLMDTAQNMRIKNVSFHRRGHQEHGTLHLTQHHLIFSYQPEAHANGNAGKKIQVDPTSDPNHPTARSRPKEIFIPYPLVHHCTLRASNDQSSTILATESELDLASRDHEVDDSLFPPTFGTSSSARPSTDSARLPVYAASPQRSDSPKPPASTSGSGSGRKPALRVRCKDFRIFALHFHQSAPGQTPDQLARQAFYTLRSRCCVDSVEKFHAFQFKPPPEEANFSDLTYDAREEFARMGISPKAVEGPGGAWRISEINHDYTYSATYPSVLCVPATISDNTLKYGGAFRSKSRIPALTYLHFNGGSITRASQPLQGIKGNRNRQDEKLVSAIFSSHTPLLASSEDSPRDASSQSTGSTSTLALSAADAETLDSDLSALSVDSRVHTGAEDADIKPSTPQKKLYGSTRENLIVDARPYVNMAFNRVAGGGIEDITNYKGEDKPTEIVFLKIENIHTMRKSYDKVDDSLGNADYVDLPPNQAILRKSGWLQHIAGVLEGADRVARTVGLGGSHALIHCSDGWDRTSQVSAVAQVMLDPHYRTIKGFITLVQKDFVSFGHKFRDRNGIEGSEDWFDIENERIPPSKRQNGGTDATNFQAMGSKAINGAKSWFEKGRGNLFKPANSSRDAVSDPGPSSRPASPPPNEFLHSPPSKSEKEPHKMQENEVSPIFHQFLDAVYQLLYQRPAEFEFNERFLRRLYYHVYACQYGDFLFNTERERIQYQGRLPSVWGHFIARREEFTNAEYNQNKKDTLLLPRKQEPGAVLEVRWWSVLFGRTDEEMNVPRAMVIEPPSLPSATSYSEGAKPLGVLPGEAIRPSKSSPNLSVAIQHATAMPLSSSPAPGTGSSRPPLVSKETDDAILEKYAGSLEPQTRKWEGSDPLGVSAAPRQAETGRMDFAKFAQTAAFSDR